MILLLSVWVGLAVAQEAQPEREPSNLAVSSLGVQSLLVPELGQADLDLLAAQRIRWGFGEVDDGYNRLWVDSRLTLDPIREVTLERARVTRLGVELRRGSLTMDLGRAPVRYGGPRLVDGAQGLVRAGAWQVGAWAGLAPDLFTTIPRLRPGGGPIVAYEQSWMQASLVGEVALSPEFQLDRAASLAMARVTADRWLDVSGRLDMDWVSVLGGPHLADAQVLAVLRPSDTWRFDALYNGFSSLRYLQTEPLDPTLRRFDQRLLDYAIDLGITQDFLDPTVNHLVGATARWQDRGGLGAAMRAQVDGRYRYHPNPANRFARVHGLVGVSEIPVGGALDVALDGALVEVNSDLQVDAGLTTVWEPGEDRMFALDGSLRVLAAPEVYDGLGFYTDLYLDAVITRTWLMVVGVSAVQEPDPDFDDVGLGAFARVSAHFR